jgi:hypothetical protein
MTNISILLLVASFFYLTNKKTSAKDECVITFLDNFLSNRYTHLFLIEREYFGFNTLDSVVFHKQRN